MINIFFTHHKLKYFLKTQVDVKILLEKQQPEMFKPH